MLARNGLIRSQTFLKVKTLQLNAFRVKKTLDKSKVPTIKENDLVEHFVCGSGPGGQKVNKMLSSVYLLHKPTGLSVKVQERRDQRENRRLARERLTTMLDNLINKEKSLENQKKLILQKKSKNRFFKQKKLTEMKNKWKLLVETNNSEVK